MTWNDEKVDTLIDQIIEYKSQRSYEGYDFETDLVITYSDIRKMMSLMYPPSDFGLVELEIENSEGMTRAELLTYKWKIETQEKQQKEGYKLIKNKVKELRRGYKNAIDKGQRSGSGRLIEDNFDRLKEIWSGSPAVLALPSGISSNERGNGESSDKENYQNEITDHETEEDNIDVENNDGLNTRTLNRDNAKPSRAICKEN